MINKISDEFIIGLVFFTLPVSIAANSISIAVLFIYLFIKYKKTSVNDLSIFTITLFLFSLQLYGFFISDNKSEAINRFIPYLPLFSIPLSFSFILYNKAIIKIEKSFMYLVVGVITIMSYAFVNAFIDVIYFNKRYDYGRGVELLLSYTPHHVYIGIFSLFSIGILSKLLSEKKINKLWIFAIPFFLLVIFILPSRIIIILTLVLLPVLLNINFKKIFSTRKIRLFFISILLFISIIVSIFDFTRDKITYTYYSLVKISTKEKPFNGIADRKKIWSISKQLIKKNYLFGYGIGDAQDELNLIYKNKGYIRLKNLNAHNQYLQFFLYYGVPLTLVLIFLIGNHLFELFKNKHYFYIFSIVTFMSVFLADSILNRQLGIVSFAIIITSSFYTLKRNDYEIK